MLFAMTSAEELDDLELILAFRQGVAQENPRRVPAEVDTFVTTIMRLTLAAIAMDEYLERASSRSRATSAKRRLRWALDHVTCRSSRTGGIAELSELTYVMLACFLGEGLGELARESEPDEYRGVAIRELRSALGRRDELDQMVAEIVGYSRFDALDEARRARALWRRLDDLDGEPVERGFSRPPVARIDAQATIAALADPPTDEELSIRALSAADAHESIRDRGIYLPQLWEGDSSIGRSNEYLRLEPSVHGGYLPPLPLVMAWNRLRRPMT
jgi:hypothetical protein